jgi:nitrite reductase/ring-hydroxylating ferredoxin subunit/uncharacterized membrane protein
MSNTNGQVTTPATGPSRLSTWHQDFFAAVEQWPWLATLNDSVSGVVQPLYDRFRGNLAVELLHGGRWAGHALHPALSDLPIGFWSGSLLLDVVSQDEASDGSKWGPAATLSAAGIAAAVATATTGVADWTVSDGQDRRVGLFHGLLNGAAMVLQSASLAARLAGRRSPALGLSAAGMAVTAAAGFVGGHLVQGRGAMVNRVAANTGPTRWVKAVAEDDLADSEPKGVDVEGRKVLLYRDHGMVYAIDDLCSHAGALLSRGSVMDCVVTCPLHESQFDVRDGHIVRGPAHHPQPALPARVRNGWVEIRGSQPVKRRART